MLGFSVDPEGTFPSLFRGGASEFTPPRVASRGICPTAESKSAGREIYLQEASREVWRAFLLRSEWRRSPPWQGLRGTRNFSQFRTDISAPVIVTSEGFP